MRKFDFLVVGSGLFGATFSYIMNQRGYSTLIVEKRDHIGGNIYTEKRDGINIHRYGAHIFHTSSDKAWDFIREFAVFSPFINSPIANYKGEIYNLPFNMNTFSKMWGILRPEEAKRIIEEQRKEVTPPIDNLEKQAISLVGRDIYEKLIKGYTEKQWGRDLNSLPPEIIKRLPIRFTYDNNYFNDTYQGIPLGGYTKIIEKMIEKSSLELSTDYIENKSELDKMADRVLYTGELDRLFGYSLGRLEFRSVRFEDEKYETDNYQGVAVMNYTDRETPYTRSIEHRHFEKTDSKVTWVSREYSVDYSFTGEPYYPINDEKNNSLQERYVELAKNDKRLILGGRLATYKYYDMDKTILESIKTADSLS